MAEDSVDTTQTTIPETDTTPETKTAPASETVPEPDTASEPATVPEPDIVPEPETVPEPVDLYDRFERCYTVDPRHFDRQNVKRGLRNSDGTGVVAGVTRVSNVHGYVVNEGDQQPCEGELTLRGFDIYSLIEHVVDEDRFGYEEVVYLLLAGILPAQEDLDRLNKILAAYRDLPANFVNNHIITGPAPDIMNMMARSVLHLYADDPTPNDTSPKHEIDTALSLIARLPRIAVLSYYSIQSFFNGGDMVWRRSQPGLSTAETILDMLRPDHQYTSQEAHMLDIMLMLQAEHGGGNNSTFTCRVLTSSGTDAYSAYAGAIGSLKGPKHGGANAKVREMCADIVAHVDDINDEGQIADYLRKIVRKEANDHTGLIYGMGHAVYTLSDPRARICHKYAAKLATGTEFERELHMLELIERLTPTIMHEEKGTSKVICGNIDLYTGFVYTMLGIPDELCTPMFATARMAGWASHRFEELVSGKRIIRPAYKSVAHKRIYVPLADRTTDKQPIADEPPTQSLSDADAIGD